MPTPPNTLRVGTYVFEKVDPTCNLPGDNWAAQYECDECPHVRLLKHTNGRWYCVFTSSFVDIDISTFADIEKVAYNRMRRLLHHIGKEVTKTARNMDERVKGSKHGT